MKKKITAVVLAGAIALSLYGCKTRELKEAADTEGDTAQTEVLKEEQNDVQTESVLEKEQTKERQEMASTEGQIKTPEEKGGGQETFSFENLKNRQFCFASGAGAWGTVLTIRADGSFLGEYFDDDMGDTGEGYPDGTRYEANFNGRFSAPVKVNDYTYSMRIDELNYQNKPQTQEIKDGTRYCYSEAYGLDHAQNILVYLPDAPLAELPEEFKSWVGYGGQVLADTDRLPFYGLYNEAAQEGFSSSDIIENINLMLDSVKEQTDALENSIENDALTQTEYNEKTKELYDLWDYALNRVWEALKQTKDAAAMDALTKEEREWISRKEEASQKAGEDYEGGTMYSMIVNQKAAELTKERVYELLEQLD